MVQPNGIRDISTLPPYPFLQALPFLLISAATGGLHTHIIMQLVTQYSNVQYNKSLIYNVYYFV